MQARHPSEASLHVDNRIRELQSLSGDLRASRRPNGPSGRASYLSRARLAIGHRLISFGSVVAGQHA